MRTALRGWNANFVQYKFPRNSISCIGTSLRISSCEGIHLHQETFNVAAAGAGRIVGVLILVQMLTSGIVNFVLKRPLLSSAFLVNAAPNSQQIGVAVILGLVTEALSANAA